MVNFCAMSAINRAKEKGEHVFKNKSGEICSLTYYKWVDNFDLSIYGDNGDLFFNGVSPLEVYNHLSKNIAPE